MYAVVAAVVALIAFKLVDLVIGLDRSDRKADLYLIHTPSGKTERQTIATSPEALHEWLRHLREKHGADSAMSGQAGLLRRAAPSSQ